jgi:hypothetical protein
MEPLNLMVSLSHFGNTIPPKQSKRRATAKPEADEPHRADGARRAFRRLRAAVAR